MINLFKKLKPKPAPITKTTGEIRDELLALSNAAGKQLREAMDAYYLSQMRWEDVELIGRASRHAENMLVKTISREYIDTLSPDDNLGIIVTSGALKDFSMIYATSPKPGILISNEDDY